MLRTLVICTAVLGATAAQAETLRIVVPFAPGGAQDTLARWYAAHLDERTDLSVMVENRAGAGGSIAAAEVAQSPTDTDAHTLLAATGGAITIAPHLRELTYDPIGDFIPVASAYDTPMTLAVPAESPFETVDDVIEAAREAPGALAFASTGHSSVSHLTGELLALATGVELLHIPYQGAAPALTDLLGGDVPLMVTSAASIDQHVSSGAARVLAVFSPVELSNLEGVPTIEEATGAEGLNTPVWGGFLAPAGMPQETVDLLSTAIVEICNLPETAEQYSRLGATAICGDGDALAEIITEDYARWESVISDAGITAD